MRENMIKNAVREYTQMVLNIAYTYTQNSYDAEDIEKAGSVGSVKDVCVDAGNNIDEFQISPNQMVIFEGKNVHFLREI